MLLSVESIVVGRRVIRCARSGTSTYQEHTYCYASKTICLSHSSYVTSLSFYYFMYYRKSYSKYNKLQVIQHRQQMK